MTSLASVVEVDKRGLPGDGLHYLSSSFTSISQTTHRYIMSTPLPSQSASGSNTSNVGLSTLSLVAVVSLVAAPFAVLMLDHYATRSRLRHIYEFAILASMVILPMVQEREPTQDPQGPHGSISTELSELINK